MAGLCVRASNRSIDRSLSRQKSIEDRVDIAVDFVERDNVYRFTE